MEKKLKPFNTVTDVADYLGLDNKTVRTWVTEGHLEASVIRKKWLITREAVEKCLEDNRVKAVTLK